VERHYTDQIGNFNGSYETGGHSYYESLILTNIGAKYRFNNKVELTAGINDLFNKGPDQKWIIDNGINHYSQLHEYYIENVMYPQQGRTYYMTVKYSF
jgi:outer membrane receptor for ferrienterochelin and colicin